MSMSAAASAVNAVVRIKNKKVAGRPAPCARCGQMALLDRTKFCETCVEEAGRCPICADLPPDPTVDAEVGRAMLCRRCKRDRPGPNRSLFPRQPRSKKNVLALEGGGLRGVFTLTILRKLEQVSGRRITDLFDLIVGCSAGGVVALGLGCLDRTIDDGIGLFTELGSEAFVLNASSTSKTASDALRSTVGVAIPQATNKYKHEPMEQLLKRHLTHDVNIKAPAKEPKVAVVTVRWDLDPKRPALIRSYDKPTSGMDDGPADCKIWEAARATSAAPTYFRPANIDGRWFVDGGLVANDPSLAALTEATALFGGTENINMLLSVGSGHRESVPIEVNPNPWLWNLANDVVKACIHHDVNQVAMKCMLGDRFLRLDASIAHSPMDDVTLIPQWVKAADEFVSAPENQEMFDILAARLISA